MITDYSEPAVFEYCTCMEFLTLFGENPPEFLKSFYTRDNNCDIVHEYRLGTIDIAWYPL